MDWKPAGIGVCSGMAEGDVGLMEDLLREAEEGLRSHTGCTHSFRRKRQGYCWVVFCRKCGPSVTVWHCTDPNCSLPRSVCLHGS